MKHLCPHAKICPSPCTHKKKHKRTENCSVSSYHKDEDLISACPPECLPHVGKKKARIEELENQVKELETAIKNINYLRGLHG